MYIKIFGTLSTDIMIYTTTSLTRIVSIDLHQQYIQISRFQEEEGLPFNALDHEGVDARFEDALLFIQAELELEPRFAPIYVNVMIWLEWLCGLILWCLMKKL